MKPITVKILASLVLWAGIVQAEWLQTAGPVGHLTHKLAVTGDTVWLATDSCMFRSIDFGVSWHITQQGLHTEKPTGFVSIGNTVLAAMSTGVFRRTTSDMSWIASGNGLPSGKANLLAVGDALFASLAGTCYRSQDSGQSWQTLPFAFRGTIKHLGATQNQVYAMSGDSLYVSVDGGENWRTLVPPGLRISDTKNLFASQGVVFIGGYSNAWSSDSGKTWIRVGLFSGNGDGLQAVTFEGNRQYMAGASGLYLSYDTCRTFKNERGNGNLVSESMDATDIKSLPGGIQIAATTRGILRRINDSSGWRYGLQGLYAKHVSVLTVSANRIGAGNSRWPHIADDYGIDWTLALDDTRAIVKANPVSAMAFIGNEVFSAGFSGGVHRYVPFSGGLRSPSLTQQVIHALVANAGHLFAATDSGVFISRDFSMKWTNSSLGLPLKPIHFLAKTNTSLLAATATGEFFTSEDSGTHWKAQSASWNGGNLICLIAHGNTVYAVGENGLFLGSNQGATWRMLNTPYPGVQFNSLAADDKRLFGLTEKGLYFTQDSGSQWFDAKGKLPDDTLLSIAANGINLFVGTEQSGVWRIGLKELDALKPLAIRKPAPRNGVNGRAHSFSPLSKTRTSRSILFQSPKTPKTSVSALGVSY